MLCLRCHSHKWLITALLLLAGSNGSIFAQGKFVPPAGCYPGAFVVNDPIVAGNIAMFDSLTGKKHASFFSYTAWGQAFPADWVGRYAAAGAVVQIAFEPNGGLAQVTDGEYIREWARAARRSGAMILLRWASEMNGSWTAWYGSPQHYIEKWRLITAIMRQEAPNVAMVWAPNDIPNIPSDPPNYIHSYYPGDNWVDWVGIDFYCVYFYENGTPERKDPRRKLDEVYSVYENRKPIIICEWAATHYSARVTPPVDCTPYAIAMMDSLYRNLQVQYPNVKSVNWFSMNSLAQNKCNYSLTVNAAVLSAYASCVSSPYFLSNGYRNVPLVSLSSIRQDSVLRSAVTITPVISCQTPVDTVTFYLDGALFAVSTVVPHTARFNPAQFADGQHMLRVSAKSTSGFSNYEETRVIIDNAGRYSVTIIDDSVSAAFSVTGPWSVSTSQPDRYGSYYHVTPAGNGSAVATWLFSVPASGWYTVQAFWSQHLNRATNAPYLVSRGSTFDTVKVNQQLNGGKWNTLGTWHFSQGAAAVKLTNNADGYVVADAIKIEYSFVAAAELAGSASGANGIAASVFPNPAYGLCTLQYQLPEHENSGTIKIVDMLGRQVWADRAAGRQGRLQVDLRGEASGIYLLVLSCGQNTTVTKITVIR